jgi:hypothetical protein
LHTHFCGLYRHRDEVVGLKHGPHSAGLPTRGDNLPLRNDSKSCPLPEVDEPGNPLGSVNRGAAVEWSGSIPKNLGCLNRRSHPQEGGAKKAFTEGGTGLALPDMSPREADLEHNEIGVLGCTKKRWASHKPSREEH